MDIPIFDGQETIGALVMERDGLYCRFEATCAHRAGLHRLWLCGPKGRLCLGVLTPKGKTLSLRKRLSLHACADLGGTPLVARLDTPEPPAPDLLPPAPSPGQPSERMETIRLFGERYVVFRSCASDSDGI